MVQLGQFRDDLYYRFKRIALHLPPLRERSEDVPLLITHFLQLAQDELGRPIRGISEEGMELLLRYDWPGNIRELENCIRSAATLARADVVMPADLPIEVQTGSRPTAPAASPLEASLKVTLHRVIQEAIAEEKEELYEDVIGIVDKVLVGLVLDEFSGNHSKTAALLGMSRTTLIKKIRRHIEE